MLPPVFAVYNKSTESFSLLQIVEEDGKIKRLKQWSRPDYSVWKAADDDEKMKLMPWMTGQEWYILSKEDEEMDIKTTEINTYSVSYSILPFEMIWTNYIIHRGRNSYTQKEWDTAPAVPIVLFSSRRILPHELSEIHVRWSEIHPSVFKQSLEEQTVALLPPLPNSEGEEEQEEETSLRHRKRRTRSWSDVSDMLEEEIEETCCSKRALEGCAFLAVSVVIMLWTIIIPFLIIAA